MARNGLYNSLNKVFSLNYTCLRISGQDTPITDAGIYDRNDVFNRSIGEKWVSRKLKDVSEIRNSLISGLSDVLVDETENIKLIEQELEKAKTALLMVYTIWFEKTKKFDEVFDGFICKDPEFAKLLHQYETHATVFTSEPAVIQIVAIYNDYLELLSKYATLKAFQDIAETLFGDFNSYGRPTANFGKFNNPNVFKINKETIEQYGHTASEIVDNIEKEVNEGNKNLTKFYRRLKKKKLSEDERQNTRAKVKEQISAMHDLNLRLGIASELIDFVGQLNTRLTSANHDLNPSMLSTISEGLLDFLTGTNSNNPKINEVYVHRIEVNYLNYLFWLLKDYITPEKSKHSDKQTPAPKTFE